MISLISNKIPFKFYNMNEKPNLLNIGNSNVGKSSITRLLLPQPKKFKGKSGKTPGSTLLIKPITQPNLSYNIIDLPGFGRSSKGKRREEHIKKQIVLHIEKKWENYFFGLIVINILRIEDELSKYYVLNKNTIPLTFELINFLNEFTIPLLIIINKIDKVTNLDKERIIGFFLSCATEFGLKIIHFDNYDYKNKEKNIPYMEFSALKKTNLRKLQKMINKNLENKKKN